MSAFSAFMKEKFANAVNKPTEQEELDMFAAFEAGMIHVISLLAVNPAQKAKVLKDKDVKKIKKDKK